MTKLVIVNSREMDHILGLLGFKQIRQKGSHLFYAHPDGRTTVVPVHPGEDLSRGLIRKILRDIKIDAEEYEKLRTFKY